MTTELTEAYYRRLRSFDAGDVEEFYSPSQPRDKEGQWSKMWSGVSAHPDHRAVPQVKDTTKLRLVQSPEHIARQLYDVDLGNGFRSSVDHDDIESHGAGGFVDTYVGGSITRGDGQKVGYWKRHLFTDDNGALIADHQELFLDPQYQGRGIADRFNSHAITKYQKYGVDRIELEAAADVGGYAWARQGFRFKGTDQERRDFLTGQLDRTKVKFNIPLLREHRKQLDDDVALLRKAIDAGEDVQPIHIASIGESYARYTGRDLQTIKPKEYDTWPGKELLLGTAWNGVYYFDTNAAVTAAASSLEHAQLRPAFRAETPVLIQYIESLTHFHDGEEFACRSAACRPPTSGGTGGSLPGVSAKNAAKIIDHDFHEEDGDSDPGNIYKTVKHFGSIEVVDNMTERQVADIRRELDYEVKDKNFSSKEPFAVVEYMVSANLATVPRTTIGMAMQLNAIAERYVDDYTSLETVSRRLTQYESELTVDVKAARSSLVKDLTVMTGVSIESGFVSFINERWAESAHSFESVAMQIVAADHRKLNSAKASLLKHVGPNDLAAARALVKKTPNALNAVFEATYRTTQKELSRRGITEIELYRGIKIPDNRGGAAIIAQPSPLSSWSTSPLQSLKFATNGDMYRATIKAENVYSLANLTGTGSLSEKEVIVLGNRVKAEWYIIQQEDVDAFAVEDDELPVVEIDADDFDWIKGRGLVAAAHIEEFYDPSQQRNKDGEWTTSGATVSMIRGDIQRERKAISAELDKQGLDPMSPLRHIFESWMGDSVAVVRNANGDVVGGVQFSVSKSGRNVNVTDMRMLERRQGHGTAAFIEIAKIAVDNDYDLSLTNSVVSAKPFYSKLGAYFQNGHSGGQWTDAGRDALAAGKPIPGADLPYDEWIKIPLSTAYDRPRKRNRAIIAAAQLCEHGNFACYDASCRPPTSGGTGGSKPKGGTALAQRPLPINQLPNGANPEIRYAKRLSDENRDGADDEKRSEHFRKMIPNDLEGAVRARISVSQLESVLKVGMLTQHDTGFSAGMFDPEARERHEEIMFGDKETRPVYGYVHTTEPLGTSLGQYGPISVVFKSGVAERTTVTYGDSLDQRHPPAPVHLTEVRRSSTSRLAHASTEGLGLSYTSEARYVEAQIHGQIRPEHISKLVIDRQTVSYGDDARWNLIVGIAKQAGIPVEEATKNITVDDGLGTFNILHFEAGTMRIIAKRGDTQAWAEQDFDPATDNVELRTPGQPVTVERWQIALKFGGWTPA